MPHGASGVSVVTRLVDTDFWLDKKVFLTGHTGFKGSWMSLWLISLGANVKGYALAPNTTPSLFQEANLENDMHSFIGDIRDLDLLTKEMVSFEPDIVIHMAAQPLVRLSYRDPVGTYSTNVMGTVHVLEAARKCANVKAIVNVTTDKCYENREWVWGYREDEPMGGADPYSNSKGCSELVTQAYRQSYFNNGAGPCLASGRAGNVIGGGDWAEDRLIPDTLRAFELGEKVVIRNPNATRPWQHVLEPVCGYLQLAESLYAEGGGFAEGWNFGPHDNDVKPVDSILTSMCSLWGEGAGWDLDLSEQPHEAQMLKLDISKAQTKLNWSPRWNLETSLESIVNWHRAWLSGNSARQLMMDDISRYNGTTH